MVYCYLLWQSAVEQSDPLANGDTNCLQSSLNVLCVCVDSWHPYHEIAMYLWCSRSDSYPGASRKDHGAAVRGRGN